MTQDFATKFWHRKYLPKPDCNTTSRSERVSARACVSVNVSVCPPSSRDGNKQAEHPTSTELTDRTYSISTGNGLAALSGKSIHHNEKGQRLQRCGTAIPDSLPGAHCGAHGSTVWDAPARAGRDHCPRAPSSRG